MDSSYPNLVYFHLICQKLREPNHLRFSTWFVVNKQFHKTSLWYNLVLTLCALILFQNCSSSCTRSDRVKYPFLALLSSKEIDYTPLYGDDVYYLILLCPYNLLAFLLMAPKQFMDSKFGDLVYFHLIGPKFRVQFFTLQHMIRCKTPLNNNFVLSFWISKLLKIWAPFNY